MLFSSIVFLFYFFPTVLVLYYALSFSRKLQNVLLLLASLVFYAWGEPVNVLLMIFSIVFNSAMGYLVQYCGGRVKKGFLVLTVACNLGILFVFKYLGFVLDNLGITQGALGAFRPALPIGISFFTFQALSYVVDVYRGTVKAENPFYVGLYISFFPQLIAGPIIQYNTVADQIRSRRTSFELLSLGLCRFTVGLGKKVLLSNCFAAIADNVFGWSAIGVERYPVPVTLAWLGSLAYSLQIYYDFSAYSDMAIGLGLCFGFRFGENFNYPYISCCISDFWRRWHISLTSWFTEYLYFPLGGSRKGMFRRYVNIMIVFLVSGLWHGAAWSFVLWGALHGVYQVVGHLTREGRNRLYDRLGIHRESGAFRAGQRLVTFALVSFAWIFFRAEGLRQALVYCRNMLSGFAPWTLFDGTLASFGISGLDWAILLAALGLLGLISALREKGYDSGCILKQGMAARALVCWALFMSIVIFGAYGGEYSASAFIYAGF